MTTLKDLLFGSKIDTEKQKLWHEKEAAGESYLTPREEKLTALSAAENLIFVLEELNETTRRINAKLAFLFWGPMIIGGLIAVLPILMALGR